MNLGRALPPQSFQAIVRIQLVMLVTATKIAGEYGLQSCPRGDRVSDSAASNRHNLFMVHLGHGNSVP